MNSLRDASVDQLEWIDDPVVRRRARHVITENLRVQDFVEKCGQGDLAAMGRLLVASHRSLQMDYEVSCEEIDYLVDAAIATPGVYGARITGGGFGGCTVNLMRPEAMDGFERSIAEAYAGRFGKRAEFYRVRPAEGAGRVEPSKV